MSPPGHPSADGGVGAAPTPVTAHMIEEVLRQRLSPSVLVVQDDSHQHVGHAGAREGRHFSVSIRSACFTGLSRVARHRLVYDALAIWMHRGIHALAIDARCPDGS